MHQQRMRAVFMRGGTSKALMLRSTDLPADRSQWDPIFVAAMGSPDPNGRQLDGMGGGLSSLSKVCVIGPPRYHGTDVDYTFAQVAVGSAAVDYSGNCGNMSSAVGPFAVDEGLVKVSGDRAAVRIYNTNTRKIIVARFALEDGRAAVDGNFVLPGVAGSGAPIRLDFLDPGGAATGCLLPTRNVCDQLAVPELGTVEVSLVDAANPCVFVAADTWGMSGTEMPDVLEQRPDLLAQIEAVRIAASLRMGIARTHAEAARKASIPKVAMVAAAQAATTLAGESLAADAADLTVRMISMGQPHRAVPLTGAMCLAVAARLTGSVAHRLIGAVEPSQAPVRIAQPSGVTMVDATVRRDHGAWVADQTTVYRTARRLMEGVVYLRNPALAKSA